MRVAVRSNFLLHLWLQLKESYKIFRVWCHCALHFVWRHILNIACHITLYRFKIKTFTSPVAITGLPDLLSLWMTMWLSEILFSIYELSHKIPYSKTLHHRMTKIDVNLISLVNSNFFNIIKPSPNHLYNSGQRMCILND